MAQTVPSSATLFVVIALVTTANPIPFLYKELGRLPAITAVACTRQGFPDSVPFSVPLSH
jgi:hypothetical protein